MAGFPNLVPDGVFTNKTFASNTFPSCNADGTTLLIKFPFVDGVIAVADAGSGATDTTCTVQLNDVSGDAIDYAGECMIIAQTAQYGGQNAIQAHVTFSAATKGSLLASGSGWAVIKTSAAGAFACTATNANDETVWFSVCSLNGGTDALEAGACVRGCIPDSATWSA
jgi:hypothetical protein